MSEQMDSSKDGQFVTLGIDREVFAVPVEMVVEILDMRPVFRIPETPPYFAGLIDVRGRGVPVIDLRVKLGLTATTITEHTRILVLEIPIGERQLALGLIADRVVEVVALDLGQIQPPPDIGATWRSDYIRGVGRRVTASSSFLTLPVCSRLRKWLSSAVPLQTSVRFDRTGHGYGDKRPRPAERAGLRPSGGVHSRLQRHQDAGRQEDHG